MESGNPEPPKESEASSEMRNLLAGANAAGISWFDLPHDADSEHLVTMLVGECAGLESRMLEHLLKPNVLQQPDETEPYGARWHQGAIRLVSTFAVYSPQDSLAGGKSSKAAANLIYQPVQLLASDHWLLSCWLPTEEFRGGSGPTNGPVNTKLCQRVIQTVQKRWSTLDGECAGDIGILVMHELASTYAPAHRHLHASLEEMEVILYGEQTSDADEDQRSIQQTSKGLSDVWGAKSHLYKRLAPLNIPGLEDDREELAWLHAKDANEIIRVDNQIDRSLENLSRLGDNLRTSFHNLRLLNADARRDHIEHRQRRVEILATIFLIPTLIVGFYGANTWIPGEHEHWGFMVMIACITVLTGLAAFLINEMHDRDKVRLSKLLRNPFRNDSTDI